MYFSPAGSSSNTMDQREWGELFPRTVEVTKRKYEGEFGVLPWEPESWSPGGLWWSLNSTDRDPWNPLHCRISCDFESLVEGGTYRSELNNIDAHPHVDEISDEYGLLNQKQNWIDPNGAYNCSAAICQLYVHDQVLVDIDPDDPNHGGVMGPDSVPGKARRKVMMGLEGDTLVVKAWCGMMDQWKLPVLIKRVFYKRMETT